FHVSPVATARSTFRQRDRTLLNRPKSADGMFIASQQQNPAVFQYIHENRRGCQTGLRGGDHLLLLPRQRLKPPTATRLRLPLFGGDWNHLRAFVLICDDAGLRRAEEVDASGCGNGTGGAGLAGG